MHRGKDRIVRVAIKMYTEITRRFPRLNQAPIPLSTNKTTSSLEFALFVNEEMGVCLVFFCKVTQGHWIDTIDRLPMSSYYWSVVTAGLHVSTTVSEINGDFGRNSQFSLLTVYLTPPLRGPQLWGSKNWHDAPSRWWEVWRYVPSFRYNTRTLRTEGRTDGRNYW